MPGPLLETPFTPPLASAILIRIFWGRFDSYKNCAEEQLNQTSPKCPIPPPTTTHRVISLATGREISWLSRVVYNSAMRVKATRELSRAFRSVNALTYEYVRGQTIISGDLNKSIWKVSWPLLVMTSCLAIIDLVHVQCAGTIDAGSQAIIGICDQILALAMILLSGLATSATAFVSRAVGKGDQETLSEATAQCIRLCAALGAVLTAVVLFSAKYVLIPFSGCVNNCPEILRAGTQYLNVSAFVLIPFGVLSAINACFTGTGQAKSQLVTMITLTVCDVFLSYMLVMNGWPIAGLGIQGIAVASVAGSTLACVIALFMLCTSTTLGKCITKLFSTRNTIAAGIASNGLPPAMQEIAWAAGMFVIYYILSLTADSTDAIAALNIGQRLESLAFVPLTALGSALVVIAGQNLGANREKRARRSSLQAVTVGGLLMAAAGAILYFSAPSLAVAANASTATVPYVVDYLRVAAFGLTFVGLETILSGALQALDDTRILLVVGFLSNWIIALPLAYLLATKSGMGSHGVWLALLCSNVVSGVIIFARFQTRPQWRPQPPVESSETLHEVHHDPDHVSRGRPCTELEKPSLSALRYLAEPPDDVDVAQQSEESL